MAPSPAKAARGTLARAEREGSLREKIRFYSRFALLQGAYAALHDLVLGAWYARPEAWPTIGYPGTPEIF